MQELNLSRRKFCLFATTFVSVGLLSSKNIHAASSQSLAISLEGLVEGIRFDPSFVRLGGWMTQNLSKTEALKVMKEAEEQLELAFTSFQSKDIQTVVTKMIANDYLQGRIVNISEIRFSVLEVALCLAVAIDINSEVESGKFC